MVIDSHVHIGDSLGFIMKEETVIESMEKYNIDYCIISNADAAELDHELKVIPEEYQIDQVTALKRSLDFARKYPNKIGVLVWLKPRLEGLTDELIEMIEENLDIIFGLKLHQHHSRTGMDDESMVPYIEFARKHNLPIMAHTGGCEEAGCIRVWNAAKKYPDVKFIMAHMGLGTDNEEAIKLLGTLPNLYGDTAWVSIESTIKAMKEAGADKMLFGSDSPIDGVDTYHCNGYGEPSVYQKYFNELESIIGKEDYDKLMYKNVLKMYPNIPLDAIISNKSK